MSDAYRTARKVAEELSPCEGCPFVVNCAEHSMGCDAYDRYVNQHYSALDYWKDGYVVPRPEWLDATLDDDARLKVRLRRADRLGLSLAEVA